MINESKIKEVFFNLLETYSECNNLILSLSFSNEENNKKSYLGGIRIIKSNIVLSIINITQKELREISNAIKQFGIKYVFIDVEKKLPFEFTLDKGSKKPNIEYSNIYAEATERLNFADLLLDTTKAFTAALGTQVDNLKFINTRTSKRMQQEMKILICCGLAQMSG